MPKCLFIIGCVSGFLVGVVASVAWAQAPVPAESQLNPQISANLATVGGYSNRDSDAAGEGRLKSGFAIQEVDLTFSANADPFFRLDVTLAGHAHDGKLELGLEEAYLSTTSLPDVTLRLGQLRAAFGISTQQHVHARRFLTAPFPVLHLFGTDHLLGTGLSAEYLAPLPFYTELTLQAIHAGWTGDAHEHEDESQPTESAAAHTAEVQIFSYVAHLKTVFELGDATSMEAGASGLLNTDEAGHWQHAWGADLRFKWVPPSAARYTSFEWLTEYMSAAQHDEGRAGLYSGVRYQWAQRWWAQTRGAVLDLVSHSEGLAYRAEALLAFAPSERTALRLQYAFENAPEAYGDDHGVDGSHDAARPIHEVFLQFIVSIGAHPVHNF